MKLEVGVRGTGTRAIRAALITAAVILIWGIGAGGVEAAAPQVAKTTASAVTSSTATLEADVNPQGKPTRYHFEYGPADCKANPCTSIPVPEAELPADTSPVRVKVNVEGLAPATVYHFLIEAKNSEGKAESADRIFATYAPPFIGLPDGRVYEQASPLDKNGGDAQGDVSLVKAAADGSGITFGSTFGIPGGKGAQALPQYLAKRGTNSWSSKGILPPASTGERVQVLGWLPNYAEVISDATKLGNPRTKALVAQSTTSEAVSFIAPYTAKAEYAYAGASADGAAILFESQAQLPPKAGQPPIAAAIQGASNLYVWDRAANERKLAGVFNDGTVPVRGTFAGSYDWGNGISPSTLREGGGAREYYLQDTHAITSSGDVYFTAGGTGQLYLRLNPTQAQSPLDKGKCTDPAKACTVHVSASEKTNGKGEGGTDPAGAQPAAFQAATTDGSQAFFTSPEMLTDDANTGAEQPKAAIGIGDVKTGAIEDAAFIPKRAVGVAVDAKYVYWADPVGGTIGRADLNGDNPDDGFIDPGEGECETEVETEPGVFEFHKVQVPSSPRYLALDAGHLYWTSTGLRDENGEPADGGGTIGRADIDAAGNASNVDPDFICGEAKDQPGKKLISNPQGIAVNATDIYWANAARDPIKRTIGKAEIGGGKVEGGFSSTKASRSPYGVALSPTHVYFGLNEEGNDFSYISRVPLGGGELETLFIGEAGIRGVATDATHVYWAHQSEETIGRAELNLENPDSEFVKGIEGKLNGLALDATHLYWSINGETPTNPGNDLYRFDASAPAGERLEDLTPLASGDGAEVQGVVGASADGSHLYFVANGVLDDAEEAKPGDCETTSAHGQLSTTSGECSLYLLRDGVTSLVARLKGGSSPTASDALTWAPTPTELFGGGRYAPKTSFTSADGQVLLFRSQQKLSAYDSEGVPQLYRFEVGDPEGIRCASCPPSGEASVAPSLGSLRFPGIGPLEAASVSSHSLAADGSHAFFETAQALSPTDTNGQDGCPRSGTPPQFYPSCLDVYEWVAPGAGDCAKGGPSYSPLNAGCIYLISTGKSEFPSLFGDASLSGEDVFFFTRQQLVGQDKDELQDVYDARVGGGLASQNPLPKPPCTSAEACHGPVPAPPAEESPATPGFIGPGNPPPKHKKHKAKQKQQKHKKQKGKGKGKKQKRAGAKGGSR